MKLRHVILNPASSRVKGPYDGFHSDEGAMFPCAASRVGSPVYCIEGGV
jgi:hypothetical protein